MAKELEVKKTNAIATIDLMSQFAADADINSGFENITAEDIALPYLTILQAMSPQVRGAGKIEGAAEGDLFNTVSRIAYKGPQTIISCAYKKAWVEWTPRDSGGGYVHEHTTDAILASTKKSEKGLDMLPNGNIIVTTAYHFLLLVKEDGTTERAIASFTSTQLKKSRRWLSLMMGLQIKVNGVIKTPPMFAYTYTAKTMEEKNEHGQWMGWDISNAQIITDPSLYAAAKKFSDNVTKGLVKVASPQPNDDNTIVQPINSEVL